MPHHYFRRNCVRGVIFLRSPLPVCRTTCSDDPLNQRFPGWDDACKNMVQTVIGSSEAMARVTGIGEVFFKVKDPEKTRNWYKEHLGFNTDEYGSNFEWRQADAGTEKRFHTMVSIQARQRLLRRALYDELSGHRHGRPCQSSERQRCRDRR